MTHIHTWEGRYFGYLDSDDLWTHDGRHVGRINNGEIFDASGMYLGEVLNDRLITNVNRKNSRGYGFSPFSNRAGVVSHVNYVGYVMYSGYEDFPML